MDSNLDNRTILVVSTTDRGEKITRPLAAVGVDTVQFTIQSLSEVPELFSAIRREDPSLVIVDSLSFAGGTVALAKILLSTPYAIRIRGDAMSEHRSWFWTHLSNGAYGRAFKQIPRYAATKLSLKTTSNFLFVSQYLKQLYERSDDGAEVINTPCFALEDSRDRNSSNCPIDIDPDRKVILAVTNMYYKQKIEGLLRAIEPLSEVLDANEDTTLVIAGDGPYRETVDKRVEAVPGDIRVPGYVSEIESLFDRSDIFVHFSLLDGYPSTVLEAYAFRTPVIANDDVGMSEQVIDGETGYLVDIDSPEMLKRRVKQLLYSPAEREELGNQGYKKVTANNNTQTIGHQFKSYLESIFDD